MPKQIKSSDPDVEYDQGLIRLVRFGSTVYLYLKFHVHPIMTRKCGDDNTAKDIFYHLKTAFRNSYRRSPKGPSLRGRLRMLWWRLTE